MNRLKLIILLGFAIMFVAGLAVGRSHLASSAPKVDEQHPLHNIGNEVGLTAAQEKQIETIWHDARAQADTKSHQLREELDRQRDKEIADLLGPDLFGKYQEIRRGHEKRMAALHEEIGAIMHDAERKTRAVLTPEQAKKFDDFVQKHHHHGPPPMGMEMGPPDRGPGMGREHRRRHGNPETAPASEPTTAPGLT